MKSPVKNHFHPRGNVYGIKPPKFSLAGEIAAWIVILAVVWVLWKFS